MAGRMVRRLLATVMIAAFVAVVAGGGAYAGSKITSAQIKDNAITTADIKDRTITGRDIADVSLSVDKLTTSSLSKLEGAVGPSGPAGPPGPAGPAGPSVLGKLVRVQSPTVTLAAGQIAGATATCPAGHNVVAGGFSSISADGEVFVSDTFGSANSWTALLDNYDSSVSGTVAAVAFCAPAGMAIASRVGNGVTGAITRAIRSRTAVHGS